MPPFRAAAGLFPLAIASLSWLALPACLAPAGDEGEGGEHDGAGEAEDDGIGERAEPLDYQKLPYAGGYSSGFNTAHQHHNDICVALKNGKADLRYPSGSPTGSVLDPSKQPFLPDPDPENVLDGPRCDQPNMLHLDVHEIVEAPDGHHMVFQRGGFSYQDFTVKYGWVWVTDLSYKHGDIFTKPSSGSNGKPCQVATNLAPLKVDVQPIEGEMRYWKSSVTYMHPDVETNSYQSYGDPGGQGYQPNDAFQSVNAKPDRYTYLNWSWVNVAGGGMVRSLVKQGATFERCGVPSITLASVDINGQKNGWVKAVYGRIHGGKRWLYGWVPYAHQYLSNPPVKHLVKKH